MMRMMMRKRVIRSFGHVKFSYRGFTTVDGEDREKRVWEMPMTKEKFEFMRDVLAAPSPVGLEGAMTQGILLERLKKVVPSSWGFHQFKGNAGLVLDTHPQGAGDGQLTCMVMGHADKIRMQVRKVGSDGKVYIDSDSHLPVSLLGNKVVIYSEDRNKHGSYRCIRGGTVEALGAIHFAEAGLRTGTKGIKPEQIYVELQIHGEKKKEQVTERLGLRPGDSILMDRPICPGLGENTFQGAYLDNGLGCVVTAELAELVAASDSLENMPRILFAFATHEEIGRFGSRVLANFFKPDVLIAVDVNHDYNHAPGVAAKNFPDIEMGKGPTLAIGSVASPYLNSAIQRAAQEHDIPLQIDVVGRDTGTDAMAGVLANIDCACASIGIPIRNMHTVSETGCTNDIIAANHLLLHTMELLGKENSKEAFRHPNLLDADVITSIPNGK